MNKWHMSIKEIEPELVYVASFNPNLFILYSGYLVIFYLFLKQIKLLEDK